MKLKLTYYKMTGKAYTEEEWDFSGPNTDSGGEFRDAIRYLKRENELGRPVGLTVGHPWDGYLIVEQGEDNYGRLIPFHTMNIKKALADLKGVVDGE